MRPDTLKQFNNNNINLNIWKKMKNSLFKNSINLYNFIRNKSYIIFALFLLPSVPAWSYIYDLPEAKFKNTKYIRLDIGKSFSSKIGGYYDNFKTSQNIYGIGIGGNFFGNQRIELHYSNRGNFYHKMNTKGLLQKQTSDARINIPATVMLNLYNDLLPYDTLSPYFNIGIGYSIIKSSVDRRTSLNASTDPKFNNQELVNKTSHNISWQAGIGAVMHCNDQVALDLGYKYTYLGSIKAPTINVAGSTAKGKYQSHEVLFGVIFKL